MFIEPQMEAKEELYHKIGRKSWFEQDSVKGGRKGLKDDNVRLPQNRRGQRINMKLA